MASGAEERRLCAVVSGDVFGYSRLMILQQPDPQPDASSSFRLAVLGDQLSNASFPPLAISPDGRSVAYTSRTTRSPAPPGDQTA